MLLFMIISIADIMAHQRVEVVRSGCVSKKVLRTSRACVVSMVMYIEVASAVII
jgi:hypothetical protein